MDKATSNGGGPDQQIDKADELTAPAMASVAIWFLISEKAQLCRYARHNKGKPASPAALRTTPMAR